MIRLACRNINTEYSIVRNTINDTVIHFQRSNQNWPRLCPKHPAENTGVAILELDLTDITGAIDVEYILTGIITSKQSDIIEHNGINRTAVRDVEVLRHENDRLAGVQQIIPRHK